MLPGTIGWTSPRNHIRVHPESLLYNRDPEQLAADVIGLSEKYAALAHEHVRCLCHVLDEVCNLLALIVLLLLALPSPLAQAMPCMPPALTCVPSYSATALFVR